MKITEIFRDVVIVIRFHQDLMLDKVEGECFVMLQRNSVRS